jgi:hypothetical protein
MQVLLLMMFGAAAGSAAWILHARRTPLRSRQITPRNAAAVLGLTMIVCGMLVSWPMWFPPDQPHDDALARPPAGRTAPLAVGDAAPVLAAQGWINGTPGGTGAQLTLVDIWAMW